MSLVRDYDFLKELVQGNKIDFWYQFHQTDNKTTFFSV
jgi:hypothetical protein